jgi:hypothetical protein
LTQRGAEIKDTDSTVPLERETAANGVETRGNVAHPAPFNIRRRIGSTTYEVEVYFSPVSGETLDDKILRLVRGGTVKSDMEGRK